MKSTPFRLRANLRLRRVISCKYSWLHDHLEISISMGYLETNIPVLKVMLHWSTCNANLQGQFATHVSRTNLQTCYTFESLSKTCNPLQHCKYREKSFATGRYTKMISRATSYHCKLALQVDQCNFTLKVRDELNTAYSLSEVRVVVVRIAKWQWSSFQQNLRWNILAEGEMQNLLAGILVCFFIIHYC